MKRTGKYLKFFWYQIFILKELKLLDKFLSDVILFALNSIKGVEIEKERFFDIYYFRHSKINWWCKYTIVQSSQIIPWMPEVFTFSSVDPNQQKTSGTQGTQNIAQNIQKSGRLPCSFSKYKAWFPYDRPDRPSRLKKKNVQTTGTIIWKRYPDDRKRPGRLRRPRSLG